VTTKTLHNLRARLASQNAASSHLRRIARLRELCERIPECHALALVGSFAKGCGDRISDLDLVAFVSGGAAVAFMDEAHRLLAQDEILYEYGQARPNEAAFRKYVFLDFASCELHTFSLPTGFKLRRPYLSVWDPENFLATLVVDEPPPRHEDFDAYPHGDDGLIWELVDCVKWLKLVRNQLAKDYLRKLVTAIAHHEERLTPGPLD
jgi:hypothetical protein